MIDCLKFHAHATIHIVFFILYKLFIKSQIYSQKQET